MTKARIVPEPEGTQDGIPPMPGADGIPLSSPSTFSAPSEPQVPAVSEALAGDLIALPFDAWNAINPAAFPLSETEKERLAGPFARIMEKYGLGKVAKDEILLGFYLTAAIYGRIKAVREAKKEQNPPIED